MRLEEEEIARGKDSQWFVFEEGDFDLEIKGGIKVFVI